ncbi:MAG: hypothetical protein NC251_11290 [Lachnoclostridium sp.]|nr:hypothetical protein [Lachnospira sp.]MCM1249004.1 hypothetical protein [Lachnoclostridium sp.]
MKDKIPLNLCERNRAYTMIINTAVIAEGDLWGTIVAHQGKTFVTKKGLPFTYSIKGGELFTDRRERSITKSTFDKAYEKLKQDCTGDNPPHKIAGPKSLNMYGAPYIWAVFMGIGLIEEENKQEVLKFEE